MHEKLGLSLLCDGISSQYNLQMYTNPRERVPKHPVMCDTLRTSCGPAMNRTDNLAAHRGRYSVRDPGSDP